MKRETFIAILSAALAEVEDRELLVEASNLLNGRFRTLRQMQVQRYAGYIGEPICYLAQDGKTQKVGIIDHLNMYSITCKDPDQEQGYVPIVVPIERVLHPYGGWR